MKKSRQRSTTSFHRPRAVDRSPGSRRLVSRIGCAIGALVLCGCAREVTRISDGTARRERAIAPQAYSAFARGRLQELEGNRQAALDSYREVLRHDTAADEAWTRIGVLNCELDKVEAARAFARAERLNATSSSLYSAKARCALRQGNYAAAASAALSALQLAPNDEQVSLLLVQVLRARGNLKEALRYAWAHVAVFPNDRAGWLALAEMADKRPGVQAQVELMARGRARDGAANNVVVIPRRSPHGSTVAGSDRRARVELEQALAKDDRRAIQRAARDLRFGTLELLRFALEVGALDLAMAQANLAGQLEPDDVMLWQLQLVLADWLGNEVQFRRLLEQPPATPTTTNQPTFQLLQGVIQRRTGLDLSKLP